MNDKMIGLIPAAGSGLRLKPLTDVTSKCLLPVYNKPMVYYSLELLKSLGMTDIIMITDNKFGGDFINQFGEGNSFGVNMTYKVQEKAFGIAHAIGITESVVKEDAIIVMLGDNIFILSDEEIKELKREVDRFRKSPSGAVIFIKEVPDAQRFGVAELDGEGGVIGIEEKPKNPKSNFAVTGLYIYDNTVFSKIKKLKPSNRGELEISDVSNAYIEEGKLKSHIIRGGWSDAGTFESLYKASALLKREADKKAGV